MIAAPSLSVVEVPAPPTPATTLPALQVGRAYDLHVSHVPGVGWEAEVRGSRIRVTGPSPIAAITEAVRLADLARPAA